MSAQVNHRSSVIVNGTNRLLDVYSVTGFLGRFVLNYFVFDIPDIGSNIGFSG